MMRRYERKRFAEKCAPPAWPDALDAIATAIAAAIARRSRARCKIRHSSRPAGVKLVSSIFPVIAGERAAISHR